MSPTICPDPDCGQGVREPGVPEHDPDAAGLPPHHHRLPRPEQGLARKGGKTLQCVTRIEELLSEQIEIVHTFF